MRPDIDPLVIEALARAHRQHVLDTYRLYGQRDGTDQPEDSDHLPLSGVFTHTGRAWRRWSGQAFEMLAIVLVVLLLVGATLTPGATP